MWYNGVVAWLLYSPLHPLLSGSTMLMILVGRKSGQVYTMPMNYVRDGEVFYTTSKRSRQWWRNLRGGTQVELWVQRQRLAANAMVIEDANLVVDELRHYFVRVPQLAKFYGLKQGPSADFDAVNLARVAAEMVMVKASIVQG